MGQKLKHFIKSDTNSFFKKKAYGNMLNINNHQKNSN